MSERHHTQQTSDSGPQEQLTTKIAKGKAMYGMFKERKLPIDGLNSRLDPTIKRTEDMSRLVLSTRPSYSDENREALDLCCLIMWL